jgi:hypothetical protein
MIWQFACFVFTHSGVVELIFGVKSVVIVIGNVVGGLKKLQYRQYG